MNRSSRLAPARSAISISAGTVLLMSRIVAGDADAKEQMIVIFMGQLHPAVGLTLDHQTHDLAYQAIID